MKNILILRRLMVSLVFTGIIIYLMYRAKPFFVLIPFLICGLSQIGVCIGALLNIEFAIKMMNIVYALGVAIFYFGFLLFALYICIRDHNWFMLLFSIPFWFVGYHVVKGSIKKNS